MTRYADDSPLPRYAAWLAETIRMAEHRWGPYEDSEIVRHLRHSGLPVETALLRRNVELAKREGLDAIARRWRDNAWLLGPLACLIAVLSGAGAAAAALGDGSRPVNLFWALGGLLGLHALTFIVWLVGMGWGERVGSVLVRAVLGAATRLSRLPPVAAAGTRLDGSRPAAAALLPRALFALLGRAGMLRAGVGCFANAWWLLALLSALLTLVAMLATRRYGFVWETTLLGPDTFVGLTQALGRLPALFGFPVPGPDIVRASGAAMPLDAPAQVLWSNWLLGCLVVYGVLPRALALLACAALLLARRHRLRVDTDDATFAVLRERLQPSSARLGVTDATPSQFPSAGDASTLPAAGATPLPEGLRERLDAPQAQVLVAIELPADLPWPPALPADAIDAGTIDGRKLRGALLDAFAAHPPARLLIACHAPQTPDRGTARLAAELAGSARHARVWLVGEAPAARIEQWRARLVEAGLPDAGICTDGKTALAWLAAPPNDATLT
ncbi:DUF2868 domain-containing protein [Verticiella sediminum]|uniref:DUF2868 domain-containing protein n=1 Tax=Verticiella sediminum TaxID=1247510 RepID=A0A556ATZ9_9BURK|nr:DUF2868 domain-containing protein [Verticiella sediminum]TSH96409.1 DUF2868 domain-containing protein [Verticiella sediminum]